MATQNGLTRRVEALEAATGPTGCQTCAVRPIFTVVEGGSESAPCGECGRLPLVFTIDIERASQGEV